MTSNAVTPWMVIGDDPPAGFYAGADDLHLAPEQRALLRSLELAERAEQREHEERVAEHREHAYNRAIMEAAQRAHAHGQQWNPARPLEFYPTREERIDMAFAMMDAQANAELRQARREAAKVLQSHGISAQVLVDASQPRPQLPGGGSLEPATAGEPQPSPEAPPSAGFPPGTAQRAYGLPRGPGEASYVRSRLRWFRERTSNRKANR